MGYRIQKVMGYGLVDLDDGIHDPRFNRNGYFHVGWEEQEDRWTTEGFKQHCRNIIEEVGRNRAIHLHLALMEDCSHFDDIHRCFKYDDESGLVNVFVVTPYSHPDWQRRDDSIDYYEHYNDHQGLEPTVTVLDVPLYPYDGYINKETGARAHIHEDVYLFRNSNDPELRAFALKELGCSLHWTEKWNVAVPDEVVELLKYTETFADEKTIYSLVPLIYTYWS